MDRQAHWQGVYETRHENEVSWFQDRPEKTLELIARSGLAKDGWIIDVGGGASRLVDHLLERGYSHIAVLDITQTALARSRARLGPRAGDVEWIIADITQWRAPRLFDLWHDRAVFHFLTDPADRCAYAATMAAAIKPGGHAIVATFAADGPEKCSGLPICRYSAEQLAAAFAPSFRLVEELREDHVTPGGAIQKFQYGRFVRSPAAG
ncbi:MAG: class I SAM-dependent methyltransferase [Proteobacteria bacterium]|nr:class I SAM-dependent methyltransferase [Pseudomonadota bacterium]